MQLRLKMMGRSVVVTPPHMVGAAMVIIGAFLLFIALSAQFDISSIGETTDPAVQERVTQLQDERNIFLLCSTGAIFLGLFSAIVLTERNMSSSVPESQMRSTARVSGDVVSALSLPGNATFLPAKHGLSSERVLVPATTGPASPPVVASDDLTLLLGKDGSSPGLLVEPLGKALLDDIEQKLDVRFVDAGLEATEGYLQILKHGYGLMGDFHFKERDGKTVLRVEYSGLLEQCTAIRKERPDTCRQMPCFGCSCILTAAARATGKMVEIEKVDSISGDTVTYTLSIREW
ncbi:MAG: hypothetical protein KKE24_04230 [Candidatus Thermoplasmatota archaeon]|nr:hypothetical protein [Candidatus Thermoplasmatota archaeon]